MAPLEFPEEMRLAAKQFTAEIAAFVQLRDLSSGRDGKVQVRLQAPEIMWQFAGEVKFGRDPRGILFYHHQKDFEIGKSQTTVEYNIRGNITTVVVNFFAPDSNDEAYARWLCRVDTNKYKELPNLEGKKATGEGKWTAFVAATTQTAIFRQTTGKRVRLTMAPIRKRVYFDGDKSGQNISTFGVFIYTDINNLATRVPGSMMQCVVNMSSDRFVFHPQGDEKTIVGLFLPTEPVDIGTNSGNTSDAKWEVYHPEDDKFVAEGEDAGGN